MINKSILSMKIYKLLSLVSLLALAIGAKADEPRPFDQVIALDGEVHQAVEAGDYHQALQFEEELMAELAALPDSLVAQNDELWANQYYDLACYQARCGQINPALLSLYNAVSKGWNQYDHLMVDHDLDNLRSLPRFEAIAQKVRERDYGYIMRDCQPYTTEEPVGMPERVFANSSDPNLKELRRMLNLDSVAGDGDEISRIKNIAMFVHELVHHDGMNGIPCSRNSLAMVEACACGKNTLNCRGMAILLNECLLSMDIPSMYVTCLPKIMLSDCHVINAVWSSQLGRWIWIDPSFNAWITDENGELLGIREVRQRICQGLPVVLNPEASHYGDEITKEWYLDYYMTKNLYAIEVNVYNVFGTEDYNVRAGEPPVFILLLSPGYIPSYAYKDKVTTNDQYFWAAPK